MASNNHRTNCANARNPGCRCSGCGGSLHGWQGWLSVTDESAQKRHSRRYRLQKSVRFRDDSGNPAFTAGNRQAYLNLVRLDLADHLSLGSPAINAGEIRSRLRDAPGLASVDSDLDRLHVIGVVVMEDAWNDISDDIARQLKNDKTVYAVRKRLANHVWCDLLVGLIRLIERAKNADDILSSEAAKFIRERLTERFDSGISQEVTNAVIELVVKRVWAALKMLFAAHFPLVGAEILPTVRILAVFSCPSVDHHPEVYEHAVKPLANNARKIVADETKEQMSIVFAAWWRRQGLEIPG